MDDEDFDPKYCLLVKINPAISAEDKEMECLEMYMENLTDDEIMSLKFNEIRSCAVIKFNQPVDGVKKLQKKSDEKPLNGYKITLETVPLIDKVLVTGLPPKVLIVTDNLSDSELVLYFESKTFCPDGGDVEDLRVLPCHHAAVVQFKCFAVVKRLKASHSLEKLQFTVRPLNIFEVVDGPCCSDCSEDKDADDNSDGTEPISWHSADEDNEDTGSQKNDTQSDSPSEMDEDIKKLASWQKSKEDTKSQSQNEHTSATCEKSSSCKEFVETNNTEIEKLLLTTIRYRKIPGLLPEDYDMIKISKSGLEIMADKKKTDHIKKALEDVQGFNEVDLADYTNAAKKLNSTKGRKWIKELFEDLKTPAFLKHSESTLMVRAINQTLAEEAAKTVAKSLLPAKIKCDQNQAKKCSKVLQDKTLVSRWRNSGNLELLGIPMDVIKAVGEIEQKLHGNRWPTR